MKKSKFKLIFLIPILLGIAALLYFTPILDIIGLTNPGICGDSSFDYQCFCGIGQVKIGGMPWRCEDLPPAPSEVTFPIETWEEARAYSDSLLGGFKCTGAYQYDNPLSGPIEKQCDKYGSAMTGAPNKYDGHIVITECRSLETVDAQGQPTGGHIVFSTRFDPNDGWVYEVSCKDDLITCPDAQFTSNWKEDATFTVGDGCCHDGEDSINSPDDCPVQLPFELVCGDGICDTSIGERSLGCNPPREDCPSCFRDCLYYYTPENRGKSYISSDSEMTAYIYNFSGTLQELDSKLKYACENFYDYSRSGSVTSVRYTSSLSNLDDVRFNCLYSGVNSAGYSYHSSFWLETINWNQKIAPITVSSSSLTAKFPI